MDHKLPNGVPKQKVPPVTWMYVVFALLFVALAIWGFADAGTL